MDKASVSKSGDEGFESPQGYVDISLWKTVYTFAAPEI